MEGSIVTSAEIDNKKTGSTTAVCTDKSHVQQSRSDIRPSTRTEPAYFSSCRSFSEGAPEVINKQCVENEAHLCHDNIYGLEPSSTVTQYNPVNNCTDMENDCELYDDDEYCDDSTTPSRPTILLYNNDDQDDNIAMDDANHMEQSRQSPDPQLSVCILDMVNHHSSEDDGNNDNENTNSNYTVELQEEISTDKFSVPYEKFVEVNHTEITKCCESGEQDKGETITHLEEENHRESKHNVLPQTTLPRCLTEPHYSLPYSEVHQPLLPLPPPLPEQEQSHTYYKETEDKQIENLSAKCANTFHTHKPHYNNFMISAGNSSNHNEKRDNVYLATNQPHRFALSAPNCMFEECKTRFGYCDVRKEHESNSMHRHIHLNSTFNNNNKITSNNLTYPTPCTNIDENLNYSQDRWHRSSESKEMSHALIHLPHKDNVRRRSQREKQISYGYVTDGYKNMIKLITHDPLLRSGGVIPLSPPDVNLGSKRTWDIQLRKWRRALHMFDYVYIDGESENETDNNDNMKNIENDLIEENNRNCNESGDSKHEQRLDTQHGSSELNINTQESKANENGNSDKINITSKEEDGLNTNKFTANTEITNINNANTNLTRKAAVIEAQRQQWVSPNFAHVPKAERVRHTLASLYAVRYSHLVPHKIPVEDNLRCILRSELCYESVRSVVPQSASSLTKGTDISPLAAGIKIHIAPSAAVLRQQHEQQLQHEQLKSILRSQSIPQQAEELVQGLTQSVMKRRSSESFSRSPSPQICPHPQETHGLLPNASPSFSPECSPEMRHLVYSQSSDTYSSELSPFTHSKSNKTEVLQLHDHVHENVATEIDHTHNWKLNTKINVNNLMNNEQHEKDYNHDDMRTNETEKCVHILSKENCEVGKWNARDDNSHKCYTHTEEERNEVCKHNNETLDTYYHNKVVSRESNFAPIDHLTDSTNQHAAHDIKTNLTCTSETAFSSSQQSPTAPSHPLLPLWEVKSTFVNSAPHPKYLPSEQQEEQQYTLKSNKQCMHHSNYDNSKAHYKHQTSSLEPPLPLRLLQREVNTTFCERKDNDIQISNNANITHNNLSLGKQEKESTCTKKWENLRYNEYWEKEHERYEEEMVNQWDQVQEHYWPQPHVLPETTTQYASNQQVEKPLIRDENITRTSNQNFTDNCHNIWHMNSCECTCQSIKRVNLPTTSVACAPGLFVHQQSFECMEGNRQMNVPEYKRDCGKGNINMVTKNNWNSASATNIHEYAKYLGQSNLPFQKTFCEQPTSIKNQHYNFQEMKQQQQHEFKLQQQRYEREKQFSVQRYNYAMYDRPEVEEYETKQNEWSNQQMRYKALKPHYHQKEEVLITNADVLSQKVNKICHTYRNKGDLDNYFNAHSQHEENKLVLRQEGSNVQSTEYFKNRTMYNRNITNDYRLTQQSKYANNQAFITNQKLYHQDQTSAQVQHSNKYFKDTFACSNKKECFDRINTNLHNKSDKNKFLANRVRANEKIVQRSIQSHVNWLQNDREPQTIERFVTKLASSCPKAKSTNLTKAMLNEDAHNVNY